jgi:sialic acid synthase SpsE
MHCVSEYPTPDEHANLRRIARLKWPSYRLGYSDHTDGIDAAVLSVALGAVMVEKHFTLSRQAEGPDHAFSADPLQFAEMVRRIRQAEVMLGNGQIGPGPEEFAMRVLARRSIVAAQPIRACAIIQPHDLAFKRPGTGLPPAEADVILGRAATRDLAADEQIRAGDWA